MTSARQSTTLPDIRTVVIGGGSGSISSEGRLMVASTLMNKTFDADKSEANLNRLVSDWWNKTSRMDFSSTEADKAEILRLRSASRALFDSTFDQMLETADARIEFLEKYSGVKFVSLGEDCLSRTVLTRWGLKPPRALGEKSGPFDLAVHPLASMAKLMERNFDGYLDPSSMEFSERLGFVINRAYKVSFNHEVGRDYAANNFQPIQDIYARRLNDWREILQKSPNICFVLHIRQPSNLVWPAVREIWDLLPKFMGPGQYVLAVVNTWKPSDEIDASQREPVSIPGISVIDIAYPDDKYVWHRHASSAGGHSFERNMVAQLRAVVDQSDLGLRHV